MTCAYNIQTYWGLHRGAALGSMPLLITPLSPLPTPPTPPPPPLHTLSPSTTITEPLSSAVGLSHAGGPGGSYVPLGLDAAAAALRSLWAEDAAAAIESPRLLAFSGLGGSASSPSPKFQRSMGMVAPAGQV